jgi:hypothetical protein
MLHWQLNSFFAHSARRQTNYFPDILKGGNDADYRRKLKQLSPALLDTQRSATFDATSGRSSVSGSMSMILASILYLLAERQVMAGLTAGVLKG